MGLVRWYLTWRTAVNYDKLVLSHNAWRQSGYNDEQLCAHFLRRQEKFLVSLQVLARLDVGAREMWNYGKSIGYW